jgi:hypothetical protein
VEEMTELNTPFPGNQISCSGARAAQYALFSSPQSELLRSLSSAVRTEHIALTPRSSLI